MQYKLKSDHKIHKFSNCFVKSQTKSFVIYRLLFGIGNKLIEKFSTNFIMQIHVFADEI